MARDYAEIEREFIAGLAVETGRDLDGWMQAIATQAFSDKNDVIDWLRQQGLRFADASKLERIHANGGRPVYLGLAMTEEKRLKMKPQNLLMNLPLKAGG